MSPPPRTRTSRTRATTSGGCCTRRGSRRGSTTRASSSSCSSSGSASPTPPIARRRARATCASADFAGSAERLERIALELRPARDRLRRQGGVPRRVRRAARARAARAPPRRDGALRAPLDLARQRSGAVGGAAALVSGLLRRALDERPEHDVPAARVALARIGGRRSRGARARRGCPGPRAGRSPRPRCPRASPICQSSSEPARRLPGEHVAPVLLAVVGHLVEPAADRGSRTTSVTSSPP